jgi:hypothetical protein
VQKAKYYGSIYSIYRKYKRNTNLWAESRSVSWVWWLILLIPATREAGKAEVRRILVEDQSEQKGRNPISIKNLGRVAWARDPNYTLRPAQAKTQDPTWKITKSKKGPWLKGSKGKLWWSKVSKTKARHQWSILATWEAKIRRITVRGQPLTLQIVLEIPPAK